MQYMDEKSRVAPLWLYGIVDTWLYYCMDFCGKPVSGYPENNKKQAAVTLRRETAVLSNLWIFLLFFCSLFTVTSAV